MRTRLLEDSLRYGGTELHSHFAFEVAGLRGDAAVAFLGPCEVAPAHMVDLEDRVGGAGIRSPWMLHLIVEHFDRDLARAVLRQRLLVAIARDAVAARSGHEVRREGDDLFVGEGKLSVSIATLSPVSGLIHLGLNVRTDGVPVRAAGLEELGVDPRDLAQDLLARYAREIEEIGLACTKVCGVP